MKVINYFGEFAYLQRVPSRSRKLYVKRYSSSPNELLDNNRGIPEGTLGSYLEIEVLLKLRCPTSLIFPKVIFPHD